MGKYCSISQSHMTDTANITGAQGVNERSPATWKLVSSKALAKVNIPVNKVIIMNKMNYVKPVWHTLLHSGCTRIRLDYNIVQSVYAVNCTTEDAHNNSPHFPTWPCAVLMQSRSRRCGSTSLFLQPAIRSRQRWLKWQVLGEGRIFYKEAFAKRMLAERVWSHAGCGVL